MRRDREKRKNGGGGSGAALLAALMFWGLLYPQFALTGDTYRAVEAKEGDGASERDPLEDYGALLNADPGEVRIRFALLDEIQEWFGEKEVYEQSGNDSSDAHRGLRLGSRWSDGGQGDHEPDPQ